VSEVLSFSPGMPPPSTLAGICMPPVLMSGVTLLPKQSSVGSAQSCAAVVLPLKTSRVASRRPEDR
jgi:hypothetical protein